MSTAGALRTEAAYSREISGIMADHGATGGRALYVVGENAKGERWIGCGRCFRVSHNLGDLEYRYCAACNVFLETGEPRDGAPAPTT